VIALLAAHAVAALLAPFLVHALGRRALAVLALPSAATAVWALLRTPSVRDGQPVVEHVSWVPSLQLELAFRTDTLTWLMVLLVGGVGALVLLYCAAYFEDDEPGLDRFAAHLTAFAGSMFGLVVSDDLLLLYVFWELTTIWSYLLIGHQTDRRESRSSATRALVVTTAGGLAMLCGIVLLGQRAGTYRLSEILADPPTGPVVTAAVVLLLAGAISKSALVPFHFWLPGAMAAPTPVSAYLHAAAMVKAGVYLVARLAPAYAGLPAWRALILGLGGLTMLLGGWRALRQCDLKLLLAYGTVSQLGFLVVLVGLGSRDAALAGLTMLVAHALFKACLFLGVGVIDHSTGTRDLRDLRGVGRRMPLLAVALGAAAASMAGLPPLLGFVGKEAAYQALLNEPGAAGSAALAAIVAGSVLTFAYSARFWFGAFTGAGDPTPVHRPGPLLLGPPAVLAVAGLLAGVLSTWLEGFLTPYTAAWPESAHPAHLGLWHGWTAALGLSLLTYAIGLVLFAARRPVESAQGLLPPLVDALRAYRAVMRGLDRVSLEVTGFLQRGSLPLSLGAILLVLVLLPGAALVAAPWPAEVRVWDNAGQLAVAVVVVVAALAAARSRRRLRAVLLVGVTGYGTAMIFLLHGAPDLALTQTLVETVSLVVFVLVLRRLPEKFTTVPDVPERIVRAVLGVLVGVAVTGMAMVASAARTAPPASEGFPEQAVDYGGGRNIVNVILVDIRAWDTMGELSVLLAAATGVASLVFLSRRNAVRAGDEVRRVRARRAVGVSRGQTPRWLARRATAPEGRRSVMFEVVTRLLFHSMVMFGLFLLFSGHNNPGGGFAAGLVVGLALAVRYLAGGRRELREAAPVAPGLLLGAGLFLSAGVGLVSMLAGGDVLQSWVFDVPLPVVGKVHLVTSLFFDLGVFLVVVGLLLDVLRSLGSAVDQQAEADAGARTTDTATGAPADTTGPTPGATPEVAR
jgi:multicomponent Na+:H+ antiporter subunit A